MAIYIQRPRELGENFIEGSGWDRKIANPRGGLFSLRDKFVGIAFLSESVFIVGITNYCAEYYCVIITILVELLH